MPLDLQVSSSEVRKALQLGRMARVQDYLGRRYRLIADASGLQWQDRLKYALQMGSGSQGLHVMPTPWQEATAQRLK